MNVAEKTRPREHGTRAALPCSRVSLNRAARSSPPARRCLQLAEEGCKVCPPERG